MWLHCRANLQRYLPLCTVEQHSGYYCMIYSKKIVPQIASDTRSIHILVLHNVLRWGYCHYPLPLLPPSLLFLQVTKDSLAKEADMQDRLMEAHGRFAETSKKLKTTESSCRKLEFELQQARVSGVSPHQFLLSAPPTFWSSPASHISKSSWLFQHVEVHHTFVLGSPHLPGTKVVSLVNNS